MPRFTTKSGRTPYKTQPMAMQKTAFRTATGHLPQQEKPPESLCLTVFRAILRRFHKYQ